MTEPNQPPTSNANPSGANARMRTLSLPALKAPQEKLGEKNAQLLSEDLFKGQRTVAIAHNGSIYRLQTTKLGKLILTK